MEDRYVTINGHELYAKIEEEEAECKCCGQPDGYKIIITVPFMSRPDSILDNLYAERNKS